MAWLTMGCPESNKTGPTVVHVADSAGDGGWSRSLGRQYPFFAAGFLGDAVVISSWTGQVLVVAGSGPVTTVPHLRHAVDTHGTLVAGSQGVVDTSTGELLWHDPDIDLVAFSPHGRLLVGFRHGSVVMLEARTGEWVGSLPHRPEQLTWEDDRHLLGVLHRGERQVMVRISVHGRSETVGLVVPDSAYRFVFETQP